MNREYEHAPCTEGKHIHNMGGPRSRTRTEAIRKFYWETEGISDTLGPFKVFIPPQIQDMEKFLISSARVEGYHNWDDIHARIALPEKKMLVVPCEKDISESFFRGSKFLRSALILSKCNGHIYDPGSPCIFTHTRLAREIKLIDINMENFYGVE